jgi:hypothetical protein
LTIFAYLASDFHEEVAQQSSDSLIVFLFCECRFVILTLRTLSVVCLGNAARSELVNGFRNGICESFDYYHQLELLVNIYTQSLADHFSDRTSSGRFSFEEFDRWHRKFRF